MNSVKIPNPPEIPDFLIGGGPEGAFQVGWGYGFESGAAGKEKLIDALTRIWKYSSGESPKPEFKAKLDFAKKVLAENGVNL